MNKKLYLAGGCFWGVEAYMSKLYGVLDVKSGYANGNTEHPTYEEVCHEDTGHAEAVEIIYDDEAISLEFLLAHYLRIVNPYTLNRQGNDFGTQYRSGLYYENHEERDRMETFLELAQEGDDKEWVIEVLPLKHFYDAEDFHQNYLEKNPLGYCHVNLKSATEVYVPELLYKGHRNLDLTPLQESVAYESATDAPFTHPYNTLDEEGIYLDLVNGEPLFFSKDKFICSCGWPSFTKPIQEDLVQYVDDHSHVMTRVEVRSRASNIHLGHVFDDGPKEAGGRRFCINGSVLQFIPKDTMKKRGYGYLLEYL